MTGEFQSVRSATEPEAPAKVTRASELEKGKQARCLRHLLRRLRGFHEQQGGLVTLEHVLIMAAFVFPMYLVMTVMLRRLGEAYGQLVFFGALPFF